LLEHKTGVLLRKLAVLAAIYSHRLLACWMFSRAQAIDFGDVSLLIENQPFTVTYELFNLGNA
jgi:hypothetical protein